jgi:hypothetical protein
MGKRLLVLSAGTGAANNLIRSLRLGEPSFYIVGCHADRFVLKKSPADRNHLIPLSSQPGFAVALRRVIEAERVELLIPGTDSDVSAVSRLRHKIPCRVFLPRRAVIDLCQDKYNLTTFLRTKGLSAPVTYPVTDLDGIEELFDRLAPRSLLWCRIRTGFGSMGAIPVKSPAQARSWISYWEEMRGVPAASFTLSEYLPGRDFSLQCLWKDGRLILEKMSERLSYFGGGSHPSGVSSTPALGKTLFEPRVAEVCAAAIRALDRKACGVFCFDLQEDDQRSPCITEINAGRFAMITSIYDLTGKHNMAVTYVHLALDHLLDISDPHDVTEDYYLVRDLDTVPGIFHADEFFDGIEDSRR